MAAASGQHPPTNTNANAPQAKHKCCSQAEMEATQQLQANQAAAAVEERHTVNKNWLIYRPPIHAMLICSPLIQNLCLMHPLHLDILLLG